VQVFRKSGARLLPESTFVIVEKIEDSFFKVSGMNTKLMHDVSTVFADATPRFGSVLAADTATGFQQLPRSFPA
jgi:hypothetical protein